MNKYYYLNHGFIETKDQLRQVVADNRMQLVLVRCNSGRFICPAQDAEHFMRMVQLSGMDYVRDVSIWDK